MQKYLVTIHASEVPFNGVEVADFQVPVYADTRQQAEEKARAAADRYSKSANLGKQAPRFSVVEA